MISQQDIDGAIDQGDILYPVKIVDYIPWWIDVKDHPIVILTPTCDVAQDKVDYHRFTVLQPLPFLFLGICQEVLGDDFNLSNISRTKRNRNAGKLDRAIKNAWPRYHFLLGDNIFKTNRIIDFEIVNSLPVDTFSPVQRIARLSSPYKEELIHRYSHHTMRIGTEDIPQESVAKIIEACFTAYTSVET